MREWFVIFALALTWSTPGVASCGLEHCPLPQTRVVDSIEAHKGELQLRARHTSFQFGGIGGSHTDLILGGTYRGFSRTQVGMILPLVYLVSNVDNGLGMSNPLLFGEWEGIATERFRLGFGLQIELPMGFGHDLVADRHWLALPYLRVYADSGAVYTDVQLGYTQAFNFGHGGDPNHVHASTGFVDPHQEGEFVYRGALGVWLDKLGVSPAVTVNGQQVVVGLEPNTYAYIGARLGLRISDALDAFTSVELPAHHQRYTTRADVRLVHKL